MKYMIAAQTDIGNTRPANEDSVCVKRGNIGGVPVVLAAVCDGMGGLEKGGLASATVVKTLNRWYLEKLPQLAVGPDWDGINRSIKDLAVKLNSQIFKFGEDTQRRLGTTLCAMIIIGNAYEIINIGDSRAYIILNSGARQLTKDQTFVQREIDMGNLTVEQAKRHPKRNMLLQCIGASAQTVPETSFGSIRSGESYLLCTDGFRHYISNDELARTFGGEIPESEDSIKEKIEDVITLVKQRGEKDNITAVVIRAV